jgi:hypothetical protein
MPFHPHKEAATLDLGVHCAPTQAYQQALDSEAELKRVQSTVLFLRSNIYQLFDQVRSPADTGVNSTSSCHACS